MLLEEQEREKEEEEEKDRDNKTAVSTSFTRHCNYFDYIREMASILC